MKDTGAAMILLGLYLISHEIGNLAKAVLAFANHASVESAQSVSASPALEGGAK